MYVTISDMTTDRVIAQWLLPDTDETVAMSFSQMATPDTTKVVQYQIVISGIKRKEVERD